MILALSIGASAQTTDDFENFGFGNGTATPLGVVSLDSTTVIPAYSLGPDLVGEGCTYRASQQSLWLIAKDYIGIESHSINAIGALNLEYDPPVSVVEFTMEAYDGFPDVVTLNFYGPSGSLAFTGQSPIDGTARKVSFNATVSRIELVSQNFLHSVILDNHRYGGMGLELVGSCPGQQTMTLTGATPGGNVVLCYGQPGSSAIPFGPCAGTMMELANPTVIGSFPANSVGSLVLTYNLPAIYCGESLQAVDMSTCLLSQVKPL